MAPPYRQKDQHTLPEHPKKPVPRPDVDELISSTKLLLHLNEIQHAATQPFVTLIDVAEVLPYAVKCVINNLYNRYGRPPPVRSITLILESMDGVAYTTGIRLDDMHKEIHLSLDYIGKNAGDKNRFRDECFGVIVHEMVHCWQHDARGSAPGGLIEGMADFVRLKSGLAPPHWRKCKEEAGQRWDEGYQKTAWFLEWLEDQYGDGTVNTMNDALDGTTYDEKEYWRKLFKLSVDDLWQNYMRSWDQQ